MSTRSRPKNEIDAVAVAIDPYFLAGRYTRFNPRYRKERNAEARAKAAKIIVVLDQFRATKGKKR